MVNQLRVASWALDYEFPQESVNVIISGKDISGPADVFVAQDQSAPATRRKEILSADKARGSIGPLTIMLE
jgi:hypothetical protein